MFAGRYNAELYAEYGEWLPYISDLYLPCADSETGDLRTMPFPGSASEQPYMSFQIIRIIQAEYRRFLKEKSEAVLRNSRNRRPRR